MSVEIPIDGTLDLHTFRPDEVSGLVREYVSTCRERGIVQVRIIHAKGIGTLRNTGRDVLSHMSEVDSFRLADETAGGWGATIVSLKLASST